MIRSRRVLVLATIVWLAVALASNAFYFELLERFWFLMWLVDFLPLIAVGMLLSIMAIVQTSNRSSRTLGLLVLVLVVGMACLTGFTNFSMELGARVRLLRCERTYMRRVESFARGSLVEELGSCGGVPQVDQGPPIRVAVPWGGWGDTWFGVVHDPSGEVVKASDDNPYRYEVANLFSGHIHGVEHLWGPWYFCWFQFERSEVVGKWRLVKDDDNPGQQPPAEAVTFNANGTYHIEDFRGSFDGRYRMEEGLIVMTIVVDGNTRVIRRPFKQDPEGLHLANRWQGFAHYVLVK